MTLTHHAQQHRAERKAHTHSLFSTVYRTVAAIKARLIANADRPAAIQYLKEHGFSAVEAHTTLKGK